MTVTDVVFEAARVVVIVKLRTRKASNSQELWMSFSV